MDITMRANEKMDKHITKIWVILFLAFSFAMMLAMPIGRVPDEYSHLRQAYIIADGQWWQSMKTRTVSYPKNLLSFENKEITVKELPEMHHSFDFSSEYVVGRVPTNTAVYPPLGYVPQAVGIKLASMFTSNGIIISYSARIANWCCIFLVLLWALKRIPAYKHLMVFLTLLPMNLQEMISVSADGMTTALVFALTAFVLDAIHRKPVFKKRDYILIAALAVGLVGWKVIYFPVIFLLFLIPEECFGSKRAKRTAVIWIAACVGLLLTIWGGICIRMLFQPAQSEGGRESTTLQALNSLRTQPFAYFCLLCRALQNEFLHYIKCIFGYALSLLNIHPNLVFVYAGMVLCAMFTLADDTIALPHRARICFVTASCISVMVVFLTLYIWWTPAGSDQILGFQGRYLMPLLLTLLSAVKPSRRYAHKWIPVLYVGMCIINCGILMDILKVTYC